MSESHPTTATNNIRFDPTCFDNIGPCMNELSVALCRPSLTKPQPEQDTDLVPKDHAPLDTNALCQDELLEADEWILVEAKAQANDDLKMPLEDGKQPLRHFP